MGILDSFSLEGKVAIVTGASSGLGREFALALAEAGADLVLGARRKDLLAETQARIELLGRRCIAVPTDVTSPGDCEALVTAGMGKFGSIDILVNNAGVASAVPATREAPEQYRSVFEVNVFGSYWMAQSCGKVMKPGSTIINVSSVLGLVSGRLPQAAYSASKAAVLGMTRDLAAQWTARKGIRVNALVPGYFSTEMTEAFPEGYLGERVAHTLSERLGQPRELAAALVFLASDACTYITGSALVVDGGLTVS